MEPNLSLPSLDTVIRYKVGRFYHRPNPSENIRILKTVTLPTWLKKGVYRKISIDENVYNLLKNDGTVSSRRRGKRPKWVAGKNGEPGYWLCHVKSPTGKGKWVTGEIAKKGYNKKAGRPPSGDAYKIRREFWRVLSSSDPRKLLSDTEIWMRQKKERKCVRISCSLVDLSRALEEFLEIALFDGSSITNTNFILKYYRMMRKEFQQFTDDDEVLGFVISDKVRFLQIVCKKYWVSIIAHLVEIQVNNRKSSKIMTDHGKITNEDSETLVLEHQYDFDTDQLCQECGEYDWVRGKSGEEVYCDSCGIVSVDDVEHSTEEHILKMIMKVDH